MCFWDQHLCVDYVTHQHGIAICSKPTTVGNIPLVVLHANYSHGSQKNKGDKKTNTYVITIEPTLGKRASRVACAILVLEGMMIRLPPTYSSFTLAMLARVTLHVLTKKECEDQPYP